MRHRGIRRATQPPTSPLLPLPLSQPTGLGQRRGLSCPQWGPRLLQRRTLAPTPLPLSRDTATPGQPSMAPGICLPSPPSSSSPSSRSPLHRVERVQPPSPCPAPWQLLLLTLLSPPPPPPPPPRPSFSSSSWPRAPSPLRRRWGGVVLAQAGSAVPAVPVVSFTTAHRPTPPSSSTSSSSSAVSSTSPEGVPRAKPFSAPPLPPSHPSSPHAPLPPPPPPAAPPPPPPLSSLGDAALLSSALAPSHSSAPRPTASPPPLESPSSSSPPPSAAFSVPFAPMPPSSAGLSPSLLPDPLQAFASQQSDQPTVDSTKDPTAPLAFPAMPDLPPALATPTESPTQRDVPQLPPPAAPGMEQLQGLDGSAAATVRPATLLGGERSAAREERDITGDSFDSPSLASPSPRPNGAGWNEKGPTTVVAEVVSPLSVSSPTSPSSVSSSAGAAVSSLSSSSSSTISSSASTSVVPSFLRPADLTLWGRIKLHPLFKHWPNIGYLISAVSVLVSDILWLRSLLIVANLFGILVNRSFNFWTGIYWHAHTAHRHTHATLRHRAHA